MNKSEGSLMLGCMGHRVANIFGKIRLLLKLKEEEVKVIEFENLNKIRSFDHVKSIKPKVF